MADDRKRKRRPPPRKRGGRGKPRGPLDYEHLIADWRRRRAREICANLDDPRTKARIVHWAAQYGYSPAAVRQKMAADAMLACLFDPHPPGHSLHSQLAADYIAALPGLEQFARLPGGGRDAVYVQSGALLPGHRADRKARPLDFRWSDGGTPYYAAYSHGKAATSTQDEAMEALRDLLAEARDLSADDGIVVALCDGPYYNNERLSNLRRLTNGGSSFAMPTLELPTLLAKRRK